MKRSGVTLTALLALTALPNAALAQEDPFPFGVPEPVQRQPAPAAPPEPVAPSPVAPSPVAPPQGAAPPAPAPVAPAFGHGSTWATGAAGSQAPSSSEYLEREAPEPSEKPRSGFVFAPKLGFLLAGFATLKNTTDCSRQFLDAYLSNINSLEVPYPPVCAPFGGEVGEDRALDSTSPILVAADALYHVVPSVRLGASLLWVPSSQVADANSDTPNAHMGSEVSLDATFEHLFADGANGGLYYRLMAGPTLLFTSGDLKNYANREKKFCKDNFKVCEIADSPFLGYNLGAGLGVLFPFGSGGLRSELLLNRVSLPFREVTATATDQVLNTTFDAKVSEEASFVRLWLTIGAEM